MLIRKKIVQVILVLGWLVWSLPVFAAGGHEAKPGEHPGKQGSSHGGPSGGKHGGYSGGHGAKGKHGGHGYGRRKGPPKDIKTTVNPIKTLTPRFIVRSIERMKKVVIAVMGEVIKVGPVFMSFSFLLRNSMSWFKPPNLMMRSENRLMLKACLHYKMKDSVL